MKIQFMIHFNPVDQLRLYKLKIGVIQEKSVIRFKGSEVQGSEVPRFRVRDS